MKKKYRSPPRAATLAAAFFAFFGVFRNLSESFGVLPILARSGSNFTMMKKKLRDFTDFEPSLLRRTPEGYLTGRIRVTGAGVFSYRGDGGTLRRLRPVKEVGDAASFGTLNVKPVTLLHPSDDVTPDNARNLSVGFSGTDAEWDGLNAYVTITVTDRKAIDAIECGDVEAVSCGYSADISREGGNWQGSEYDEVMSCIRYNHIALVKAGRAGDGVKFRIGDNADADFFNNTSDRGNPEGENMKTMIIDGVQCQADEAVVERVQKLEKALKDASDREAGFKSEMDKAVAARDAATAEVEKLKAERMDDEAIAKAVSAKLELVEKAKSCGCDVTAKDSDDDIRKAVIRKAFGDRMDVEGKSAEYVASAFDSAVISLGDSAGKRKQGNGLESGFNGCDSADPEKAYADMCGRLNGTKKEG